MISSTRRNRAVCPNCREVSYITAMWPYLDPRLVTQADPRNPGVQVPNYLESERGRSPITAAEARELMLLMTNTKLDTMSLKKCGQHVEK